MTEFVDVMAEADLAPGGCTEVLAGGQPVAVFNVDGVFHAIGNRCPHRGGPLGQGSLDGKIVFCPWHAWTYDVTTGVNTENPEIGVPRFDVKVEGGHVFVKVG